LKTYLTILVILIAGWFNSGLSQSLSFKTYTIQDGLVGNSVQRIFQDSKGFIWIGTWEGLSKYDGHRFTNYSKSNGLVDNLINDICENQDGQLFVSLNNGSTQMLINERVYHQQIIQGLTVNRFLKAGNAGLLMLTDEKGIQKCNIPELQPTSYVIQTPHSLFVPVQDSLLLVTTVEGRSLVLYSNSLKVLKKQASPAIIFQLLKDSHNRIWAASSMGLKQVFIDPKNYQIHIEKPPARFQRSFLIKEEIRCMLEDDKGDLWIGTRTGLVLVEKNGPIQKFTKAEGLPGDHIYCLMQDREKNIWIGTAQGVARIANQERSRYWTTRNGLLNDYVIAIAKIDSTYILGTGGGIQKLERQLNQFINIQAKNKLFYGLIKTNSGVLANTIKGHIASIDLKNNRIHNEFKYTLPENIGFLSNAVSNDGKIFIGCYGGLLSLSKKNQNFNTILPYDFTTLFITDNTLWAGTYRNGLYKIPIDGNENIKLSNLNRFSAVPDSMIRSMYIDSKGVLWVGTRYNGVYKIIQQKDQSYQIEQFDQKRGLLSDGIRVITEDKHHNIWLGSWIGVDKLIKEKNGWRIFNFSRFSNLFGVINTIVPDDDESIWVGMNNGLANIPDLGYDKFVPLPVYITRIQARFKNDSSFIPAENASIALPFSKNAISFDFSSPGFINEKEMKYSYRLIRSDDTAWSIPASQQSVNYASLQPGYYRFEVRNLGWNGEWGKTTSYFFTILPPVWTTWWFICSVAAVIILLLYILYRYRIRQLQRIQQVRNRIATDLHDDIGSTLTNISILAELSKRNRQEPEKAEAYLDRISEEIDASGQALDDIIWSVNSKNDTMHETAARMRRYAAELFDARNIRYELKMDPLMADKKIMMEQRRDLFLMFKETLNNIQKHAKASVVSISLFIEKENIILIINDNGNGFDATKQTHGNGIKNLEERVSRWKGGLIVESGNGNGTTINVRLPLSGITQNRE